MGIIVDHKDQRTKLQERLEAELRAKAELKAKIENEPKDTVEDSAYLKDYKHTTTLAPVWLLIFFATIIIFIYFITQAAK